MFNQWSNNNVTKNKPLFTSFTYLNYNIISIHVLKKNKNAEVKYQKRQPWKNIVININVISI